MLSFEIQTTTTFWQKANGEMGIFYQTENCFSNPVLGQLDRGYSITYINKF